MSVRVLQRWDGFCLSCSHDARPLVLTLTGATGLRAWLDGAGWHDRDLHLTCLVCGYREHVPWDEADDPEQVSDWRELEPAPEPVAPPVLVEDAPEPVPAPRPVVVELPRTVVELPAPATGPVLELLAAELHLSA